MEKSKPDLKTRLKNWLKQYGYAVILTAIVLIVDCVVYWLTRPIAVHFKVHNFTIVGFDDRVPLVKIFFIPYFLSYPYWFFAPIIAAKNRRRFCNWFVAVMISFFVVAVLYCFMPTTIERPIDELLASDSALDRFIGNFYLFDGGYVPFGCFPSIHCLLSAFCYIGVRGQKNIHIANRVWILAMDLLILLATQFTKQHYIVDMISSVTLAELTFLLCNKLDFGGGLLKLVEKIESRIFKNGEGAPAPK
ncbi:MAG: phosphatase PAP2 family protein [Lachnospiraceae bacterium]|nr:phosphatase PAP2 family protein [Lachnospiraceae bacterium]